MVGPLPVRMVYSVCTSVHTVPCAGDSLRSGNPGPWQIGGETSEVAEIWPSCWSAGSGQDNGYRRRRRRLSTG